jgi:hypothetical protein
MLKILLIGGAVVLLLLVTLVCWGVISVKRGARRRDEKLLARLEPIAGKIETGAAITESEIEKLAAQPENRFLLAAVLRGTNRLQLLPTKYNTTVAQCESALAYWLMHPHELQEAPESIERVDTVSRSVEGHVTHIHVFRYRMKPGHWAAKHGWLLGVGGPIRPDAEPYSELPGAFSRCSDVEGKVTPSDLVSWYIETMRRKGMAGI